MLPFTEKKGILVFDDKGGKFIYNRNNLKNLTWDSDIKVGTQDKNGRPVALTMEFSKPGTLDRETFERAEGACVLYTKTDYEKTPTDQIFAIASGMHAIFRGYLLEPDFKEKYIAQTAIERCILTKEEYYDVDFYTLLPEDISKEKIETPKENVDKSSGENEESGADVINVEKIPDTAKTTAKKILEGLRKKLRTQKKE